jgi:hypothetical protein
MKSIPVIAIVLSVFLTAGCETKTETSTNNNHSDGSVNVVDKVVEASCGQCQFELKGNSCDLAVRIDGKSYFVDGNSIDDFGDAHAEDGLCNMIRKAKVSGEIKNGRFIATSFELLPLGKQ